jgi:hypothetical protein
MKHEDHEDEDKKDNQIPPRIVGALMDLQKHLNDLDDDKGSGSGDDGQRLSWMKSYHELFQDIRARSFSLALDHRHRGRGLLLCRVSE